MCIRRGLQEYIKFSMIHVGTRIHFCLQPIPYYMVKSSPGTSSLTFGWKIFSGTKRENGTKETGSCSE